MVVFRILGAVLIAVGLMLLGADVVTTLEQGGDLWRGDLVVRSFDQVMVLAGCDMRPWIETTLPEPVSGWLLELLAWPAWLVTGVPGLFFTFIGGSGE
ncbi:MAG: hypothetical protein ACT4OG_00045 [Alphaproteobacteria bacterium]